MGKSTNQFLIVKCEELDDQYECDADRTPLCIVKTQGFVEALNNYKRYGFEIYEIYNDGHLELIQNYYDKD